jgi:hypothetical protein
MPESTAMDDLPVEVQAKSGCVPIGVLFVSVCGAGALLTMVAYVLVVEQWGLIAVRREFGYDMLLYAPLAGLIMAVLSLMWAMRQSAPRILRVAGLIAGMGALILIGFAAMGAFF